ncbi:hypothetical protein [Streptomyces sp. NBC_01314]|uniref:hypothetical protein n=1 Tax=Streptomyces sp. NBC_01314 TaxID=2903821 RepID=UPI003088C18E|nr:hypothetical protein OG622_34745 [Streptomyces sp. NBC_01314]
MSTLFRYLVDQREWKDPRAFLPRFREVAQRLSETDQDPDLATCTPAASTYEAWYYNQRKPNRDARRVLVALFACSFERLWGPAGNTLSAAADEASRTEDRTTSDAELRDMRKGAEMAARRARDFAMGAERGQLGEETMGFLQDEVRSIAERYPRMPLTDVFDDLVSAQDEVFRHIEGGRSRPSQLRQLHIMATLLSWFMAKASHDMGDPATAMTQARAAGVCAQQAEHQGLIALTDGLKSLITYWSGNADDALHYARKGAAEHPDLRGTTSVWLASLEARAAALLGDAESVLAASERAERLRERTVPDDIDGLGGLLTFRPEKQLYYVVESHVLLGHGDARTANQAEQTVEIFSNPEAPHWAFGDQAGAHCNLTLTRLHANDLDGAAAAIRPVLDLPPRQRNRGIVVSAQRVQVALSRESVRTAVVARDLREEIALYPPSRPALLR